MANEVLGSRSMILFIQESIALSKTNIELLASIKSKIENMPIGDVSKEIDAIYQKHLSDAKEDYKLPE